MADYESGLRALEELAAREPDTFKQAESDLNEAGTRFQIRDCLISDVLCWSKSNIKVEHHDESGYSDYEMGTPSALLVEAKKEGTHFTIPSGWSKSTASLRTLFSSSEDIEGAVKQAIDYSVQ